MKLSPLQFARRFAELQALSTSPAPADSRLLSLLDFWPQVQAVCNDRTYTSYADEYFSLVTGLNVADSLGDLNLSELEHVSSVLREMEPVLDTVRKAEIAELGRAATFEQARLSFHLGETNQGLTVCASLADDTVGAVDFTSYESLAPFDALEALSNDIMLRYPRTGGLLKRIVGGWAGEREAVYHDRVWCLFVDRDGSNRPGRGRMRCLHGHIAVTDHTATDIVAFDNQIRTKDDPFIGVAYDALKAVRRAARSFHLIHADNDCLRADFSIPGTSQAFTGDSIGLGMALVAFTQLLQPQVRRMERFLSADVAVTGGVDPEGRLTAVSEATVAAKVERAFYSHVNYLVVPDANLQTAQSALENLHRGHPRRRLRLIGAASLDDVLENRNVIRAEKVCIGEFMVRKAARVTRSTWLQIPLLAALLYALICVLYPKAWIAFPRNPVSIRLDEKGFTALNEDSVALWSTQVQCDAVDYRSRWRLTDLDGDGRNEVAFLVMNEYTSLCSSNASLIVYGCDGDQMFQRYCGILGQYPGDTSRLIPYRAHLLEIMGGKRGKAITTVVTQSSPSRSHIRFWSATGDSLGWYVNQGTTEVAANIPFAGCDSLQVLLGINNRVGSACLFVVDPGRSFGVSPPYADANYDLSKCRPGNQLCYILFPPTDLDQRLGLPYNGPHNISAVSDSIMTVTIVEAVRGEPGLVSYQMDTRYRIVQVSVDDSFKLARDIFVLDGKLPPVDWDAYAAALLDKVTYWTDSGWVTEGQLRAVGH